MVTRPENHVTREMQARLYAGQTPAPLGPTVPEDLLVNLETTFPPRCRQVGESELSHERYAGKVDLIAELRKSYDRQQAVAEDPDPDNEE